MMLMMITFKPQTNFILPNSKKGIEVVTSSEPTEGMRSLSKSAKEKVQKEILGANTVSGRQKGN